VKLPEFLKKFLNKPPFWFGPLAGALIGILVGIPGIIIGLVMGYLVQELVRQFRSDRAASSYLENPGRPNFNEGEPGFASWCALCVLILGEETGREAAALFPWAETKDGKPGSPPLSLTESFCRIAEQQRGALNPDLLAESLASRRRDKGDLSLLGKQLHTLAQGEESLKTAARIRAILDPGFRAFEHTLHNAAERLLAGGSNEASAWEILGLHPGASPDDVKSTYRRLARQFHPDSLSVLNEEQQKEAEIAFIKIQEAYREILGEGKTG
jgi:DnaJ-domain-containing protein 1